MKPLMDEDYAYEQARQRRIDEEFQVKKSPNFGKSLMHADWVQRYAHHDPAPQLPFEEDLQQLPCWQEATIWLAVASILAILLYGFLMLPQ